MRLSPSVDLAAVRAAAVAEVDRHFAATVPGNDAMAGLYRAKAALAQRTGGDHPLFHDEAARRGMTPAALATAVTARADGTEAALIAHEAKRQAAKRGIADASSEHAVRAILSELTR